MSANCECHDLTIDEAIAEYNRKRREQVNYEYPF